MKAGVVYGINDVRVEDMEKPQPKAGEVLVKIKRCGICGSDLPRVKQGMVHKTPIVLGHEFSGVIEEVGEGVDALSVGDRISGVPLMPCMACADCQKGNYSLCKHYTFIGSRRQGAFAEYVVMPAVNAVKFDPSVSFEQGALFEPATVALHGLRCADYVGGKDVAVLGGGSIGLFVMQWAKIFGARSVTVFDISQLRLALAQKLGADRVLSAPDGNTYDFVFETAGQTATMYTAFEIAANKARICFVGTPHEDLTFTPKLWENMNRKEFMLTGSWMSYSAPFPGEEWGLTAHYFATGQLRYDPSLIWKTLPLSRIADAFALFDGAVGGKVMIDCEG